MASGNRPLIAPLTDEQRRSEEAVSRKLHDAESVAARDILGAAVTPDALQRVVENAGGFAEAMTVKHRDPATPEVACKEGCHWCCFQSVPVSAPEVFRIARFLSGVVTEAATEDLINRLRKLDEATRGLTSKARAKLHLPCAFLAEGRCAIYSVRPLACAEFTSFNVQDCMLGQRAGFKSGSITHEKARMVVYFAVQRGLIDGLRKALPASDTTPLELTAAVIEALDCVDAETAWIGGGKVFVEAHVAIERL